MRKLTAYVMNAGKEANHPEEPEPKISLAEGSGNTSQTGKNNGI